jgi:arsenate reductase-like glutaredoxin family protein
VHNKIEPESSVDARKEQMGADEALALAKTVKEIYSCKGSKIIHFDLSVDKPSDDELLGALLGPSGNLRAPSIKVDNRLLVGFNEDVFKKTFKQTTSTR